MMTPWLLLLVFMLGFAALLIWILSLPDVRLGSQLYRANQAMAKRRYQEALRHYDSAERLRPRIRDDDQAKLSEFAIAQGRGMVLLAMDRFSEAEPHLIRATELLNEGVEQDQAVIVFLHADLACTLLAQDKVVEAEAILTKVEELCVAAADDTEDIAELLSGAASGAAARNQFDVAFRLARNAVEMLSKTPAWHTGQLADAQINLAAIHSLVGEFQRARELIEQAINSAGDDQLDGNDRDNAEFYLAQLDLISGDFPQAIDLLQQSVTHREKEAGRDHWNAQISRAALANAYRSYGDYQTAEKLFRRAYESQAKQLDQYDLILIGTGLQFALLLCDLGKFDEADQLLQAAESIPAEIAGTETNTLAMRRLIRGIWHLDQSQFAEAMAALEEAVEIAEGVYGESNIMTADYRGILGSGLVYAGRFEEAEPVMQFTLRVREAAPDGAKLDFAELLIGMAELYLETDRIEEAAAAVDRARDVMDGIVLPTNLTLARLHTVQAKTASRRGAHQDAINHVNQAEAIYRQVQPAEHANVARLYTAAVEVYTAAGDTSSADRYREPPRW